MNFFFVSTVSNSIHFIHMTTHFIERIFSSLSLEFCADFGYNKGVIYNILKIDEGEKF